MHPPAVLPVRGLLWRVPLAALGGLGAAVVLAVVALGLGGLGGPPDAESHPAAVLLRALLPVLGVVATTGFGLLWGVCSVAVLIRAHGAGAPLRLAGSAWRALHALPALVVLAVVGVTLLLLSVLAWPLFSVVVLGRSGWRLRTQGRDAAASGLWLAVPLAPALVVLTALPTAFAAALERDRLPAALRRGLQQPARARARVGAALVGLALASAGLGAAVVAALPDGTPLSAADALRRMALSTAASGLAVLVLVVLSGVLLGRLDRRVESNAHGDVDGGEPLPHVVVPVQRTRVRRAGLAWKPTHLSVVALLVSAVLTLELAASAGSVGAPALAATPADIVVDDLGDAGPALPGACVEAGVPCGVRPALALAGTQVMATGVPKTVGFSVSGTVTLGSTLPLPHGVTLDGEGQSVVLDAHQAFRAIDVPPAGDSGLPVALRRLSVVGGQSADAGAGLRSQGAAVELDRVVFRGNVSGTQGGGVSVTHASLTVLRSTFTDNRAAGAGGAVAADTLTWINSTSYRDTGAPGNGGAISATYGGTLLHATVVGGGGVAGGADNLTVLNSIVETPPGGGALTCMGIAPDSGGNIDPSDPATPPALCLGLAGVASPYGALADNGGPTPTVALLPGSAAVGAGLAAFCAATDQRGVARPAGGRCDAGAFQLGTADYPTLDVTLTASPISSGLGGTVDLTARVTSTATVPAGTFRFLEGSTVLGEATATEGSAGLTVGPLSQGRHELRTEFVPADPDAPVATSAPLVHLVRAVVALTLSAPDPTRIHDPATITATLSVGDASDPALSPSGTVTFSSGGTTADVPVAGSAATWTIPALGAAHVYATYSGDDAFGTASASTDVTTEQVATVVTGVLSASTAAYGAPLTLAARVDDAVGPVPGSVELLVDGVPTSTRALTAGATTFALSLPVGEHTLVLRSEPAAGWATADSVAIPVEVTPAASAVVLTAPTGLAYGQLLSASAAVTGGGRATVRLLDGGTEIASVTDVGLPATVPLSPARLLRPGSHTLVAEVVASSTSAGARSEPVVLVVAEPPSSLALAAAPGRAGTPTRITVTGTPADLSGSLVLTADATGAVLATGRLADGTAELSFSAAEAGALPVTVSLTPDAGSLYLPSAAGITLAIPRSAPGTPALSWTDDPLPHVAVLDVVFPPSAPHVTGTVVLRDSHTGLETRAELAAGPLGSTASLRFEGTAGQCYCDGRLTLDYLGDTDWTPSRTGVPDVSLPAHPTVTTLDAPQELARTETLRLQAAVTSATSSGSPAGRVEFLLAGVVVSTSQVGPGLPEASMALGFLLRPGEHAVSARFVPSSTEFAPSTSAPRTVTILRAPLPEVELTALDEPEMGEPLRVRAVAVASADQLRPGSALTLVDGQGQVLAVTTWVQGGSATFTFSPQEGGPLELTARFRYGPDDDSGKSVPLSLVVQGKPARLSITHVASRPAVVGQLVPLRVSLDAQQRLTARPFDVQLLQNGEPFGSPVRLHPSAPEVVVAGRPEFSGTIAYTVVTDGDGHSVGAGGAGVSVDVEGAQPRLLVDSARVTLGAAWTPTFRVEGVPDLPAPTSQVEISLTRADGTPAGACSAQLPESCTFLAANLTGGRYAVLARYLGDAVYAPAEARAVLVVAALSSRVDASFDPPPDAWFVGQQVQATWTASILGVSPTGPIPATGEVTVTHETVGTVLCRVDATAGGCSFAVPDTGLPLDEQKPQTRLVVEYVPDGLAQPSTTGAFGRPAPRCLTVTPELDAFGSQAPTVPPRLTGRRCSVNGEDGFAEGSWVRARLEEDPYPYRLAAWGRTGAPREPVPDWRTDREHGFVITEDTLLRAVLEWAPRCVEITYGQEENLQRDERARRSPVIPGYLEALTPPNCAGPSPRSEVDYGLSLGYGTARYVEGTVVRVRPHAVSHAEATSDRPVFELLDVPGATSDDGGRTWSFPAEQDMVAYGRFRMSEAMCRQTVLTAGPGGTISIAGAAVPDSYYYDVEDPQGRCVTADGEPGFLSGTALTVRATPSNDGASRPTLTPDQFFFSRWLDDWDLSSSSRVELLTPTVQGTAPDPSAYRRVETTVTVPDRGSFEYGASFARIACYPVEVVVEYPVDPSDPDRAPELDLTPTNCPAHTPDAADPDARSMDSTTGPIAYGPGTTKRIRTVRAWYLAGTGVSADAPKTFGTGDPGAPGASHDSELTWEVTDDGRPVELRVPYSATVAATGQHEAFPGSRLRFFGRYLPWDCRSPNVTVRPSGFEYTITNSTWCPEGKIERTISPVGLDAVWHPYLVPVWSLPGGKDAVSRPENRHARLASDGFTAVVENWRVVYDELTHSSWGRTVRLDYCAPIPVEIDLLDVNGVRTGSYGNPDSRHFHKPGSRGEARDLLTDGSSCPAPLLALPGETVGVGLNGEAAATYSLVDWTRNGQPGTGVPTVSVPVDGPVDDRLAVRLQVRCQTLSLGEHVRVVEPAQPNCPGANGRPLYLRNTVVTLQFDGGSRDEFNHWTGADATEGESAAVVLHSDRSVSVDYSHLDDWEAASRVLSNLAQRTVAALTTAATGVAMGFMFVAQAAALTVVGISAGLQAVGVEGAALDRMDSVATAVQSGLDTLQSVQDCAVSWSTGGSGPAISLSSYQAGQGQDVGATAAELALESAGHDKAAGSLGALGQVLDAANLVAGGLQAYVADPQEAWAGITEIGSCVRDSAVATYDASGRAVR